MIRRLSLIGILAASLSPLASAVTKNKSFPEYTFGKGVDTYHAPTALPQGYSQNALNVLFDDVAPATKRAGYTIAWSTKSYSYTGLWTYTDGTNTSWQITRSSDQLTANNLSGTTVKIATVSVNNIVGQANAFGYSYFVDQTQGVYYWNGSSTTFIPGSPLGSILTSFHGRLWVTGAAVPNGNQLYGSGYFAGNTWTTGLNATDPVQYSVGLQDNFDNLTAEYVYLDTLYLFKHSSIYALYGFDQTNFQISQLTQECGCIDGGTIQTYNSALEFVSLRGVESFNGYSCKRISDAIKNKIDPAIQTGTFSQQSWVQQAQSDWQSGTITNSGTAASLSTTISPPTLVLSTGMNSDTTTANFQSGTLNNLTASNNQVVFRSVSGTVTNPGFESGSTAWNNGGTGTIVSSVVTPDCGTIVPRTGSFFLLDTGPRPNPITTVVNAKHCVDNSVLSTLTINQTIGLCSGYGQNTVNMSGQAGKCFFLEIFDSTNGNDVALSDHYFSDGTNVQFYSASYGEVSGLSNYMAFDDFTGGVNTALTSSSSGTFTSRSFDTGFNQSYVTPSASWTPTSASTSLFVPTYTMQSSVNNSTWIDVTSSTGSSVLANRYIRYLSTFAITSSQMDSLESFNSSTFTYIASSGTFKSPIHSVGALNSWGNFSVADVLNGGNIAFSVCSSTNSNMGPPSSCSAQTPNSQITVSTGLPSGTYVQWYATFTVTNSTQNPVLQSGTVQWFTGSKAIPLASTVWDNRYWLSLTTTTTDTANDAVLVLNQAGAWAIFDIHAGAFTQYKNSLYHADSLATGKIYLDNQGWADNGQAINTFINTRNESLGDLASDDYMYALYPTAMSTGDCPMTVQYSVDNSTTVFSLGSPLLSEFNSVSSIRLPFPIDAAHQVFGQSVDFTIGTNDASCGWQFLGIEGLFKQRPVQ